MSGTSDANISYADLCTLLLRKGYTSKQSGSRNIFRKAGCDLINLQDAAGKAKSYQVKQVREQLSR